MVCKYVLDSDAQTVILPIQDICGYKGKTRVNVPGLDDQETGPGNSRISRHSRRTS